MALAHPTFRTVNHLGRWLRPLSLVLLGSGLGLGCTRAAPAPSTQSAPAAQLAEERVTLTDGRAASAPGPVLPQAALARASAAGQVSIADVVERVVPSVVNIALTKVSKGPNLPPGFSPFFGPEWPSGERREQGMGSGVIISADGVVLTNNHVVEDAEGITVTTSDKREFQADVLGTDPKSDLAVIRLKGDLGKLTPIQMGDSSRIRLGDVVIAIGNPFGVGQTVTMGIVSAKGRADVGIVDYEDFIQTDAAINPGNSGGALIDMEGNLIGINAAILSRSGGSQGIGFAIPTEMVKPIMSSLLAHGKVERGWLGVAIQDVSQDLARALKLPSASGVLISDVRPGGPADKGGVKRGDVVLKVNGTAVDSTGHLRNLVASAGAEHQVTLEIVRDGRTRTQVLKLGTMDDDSVIEKHGAAPSEREQSSRFDGLTLQNLDDGTRTQLNVPRDVKGGVLVTRVSPQSAAGKAGLQRGDIVLEVDRKPVNSLESFARVYKAQGDVLLLVQRRGATLFVVVKH